MRHLITGGAGFIGSHLAEALLARGDEVQIIDNLATGSMDNVAHLKGKPGFSYVIDTLLNESLLAELVDGADRIHHLAAAVGVQRIIKSPVQTIEVNTRGTEVVLQHAAKKEKRVLFASTSEVYGKSTQLPFSEDGDIVLGTPQRGRWSYACSKALDEFLCIAYWRERSVPTTVLRLFNTVGPRQVATYGMVLPTFVRQALSGQPITVFGNGEQTRCFSSIHDVIRCWLAISDTERSVGGIYNVGSTQEISIAELAAVVKEVTGSQSQILRVPYETAYESGFEDMPRRVPDLQRLRAAVGFAPETPVREIVEEVVQGLDTPDRGRKKASIPTPPTTPALAPWRIARRPTKPPIITPRSATSVSHHPA
ncbi:MAG: GDP-mannose 4,6-dehydratase [Planctomycetota bacterium]